MDLKPENILEIEFSRSFRGYNEDEVNEFIEEIAEAVEAVLKEKEKLLQENEEYRRKVNELSQYAKRLEGNLDEWKKQLETVFNRGFHTGYYFNDPTKDDQNRELQGNASTIERVLIGTVENYYDKISVASIIATYGSLSINDEILIESSSKKKDATYFTQKIESLQIDGESVDKTPQASTGNHLIITIKTSKPVKKGDRVFLLKERQE